MYSILRVCFPAPRLRHRAVCQRAFAAELLNSGNKAARIGIWTVDADEDGFEVCVERSFYAGRQHAADLKHFTQVDEHIFAGSKPTKAADFEFLRQNGVKYILQADFLPGMSGKEQKEAAKFGIQSERACWCVNR
jgi:hypothetical protein